MFETVLYKIEDGVALITLNRPDRLNAANDQLVSELSQAIAMAREDKNVRALVLTGSGRAFCAGADVGGMQREQKPTPFDIRNQLRDGAQKMILNIQKCEKPVIAAINGVAAGGGFDLACACDMRFASDKARFLEAFVRIGLFPGWGGTWMLPRIVGLAKAAELIWTGDEIDAKEAERIGLVSKVVPHEALEKEVMALAKRLAQGPSIAITLSKIAMYKGLETDLETALEFICAAETLTLTSGDHAEGVKAFREKRKANFQGR
ncbi:MAG: enoyl-CoA hydratase/isomerase family protein [Candidatus Tectomicrobia bacterium]|uniref:Enoyl-CoA hydratase/isomerase family protein n=1 Tax=Tectimicrobiota bacterium TaxID=2528274 RepID=A0A933GMG8_UNCTE|nr:enoyl-CoA hydratase/isomerase family protein [Candidatus Tectomicrobia bacterium]